MKDELLSLNFSNVSLETVEWREFVDKGLPFTVFLSILSIIGTLGNAMVFLTNRKSDKPSNFRILIQCLALIDFLSCAIGIPGYALMSRYQYTFESDVICRISTVFHFFVGICSLTILSFTAVERFRKTCKPFGSQFSQTEIRKICVCLNVFGFSLSVPSALAFDSTDVILNEGSLIGHSCKLDKDRTFSKVYIIVFVFCLIFCVLVNTILYSLIGRTIILQTKRGPKTMSFRNPFSEKRQSSPGGRYINNSSCPYKLCEDREGTDGPLRMPSVPDIPLKEHSNTPNRNISLKGKALYEKSVQISVMFLVCSLLSCASFVPLLVFRCIEIYDRRLQDSIFEAMGPLAAILNRFHVINHVINPIVYCLLCSNFRKECISLFSRKCK